jgi:hypothetical protein
MENKNWSLLNKKNQLNETKEFLLFLEKILFFKEKINVSDHECRDLTSHQRQACSRQTPADTGPRGGREQKSIQGQSSFDE